EHSLPVLAVAVGVDVRLEELLLRLAVGDVALAEVALGLLEHLAALLAGVNRSLDACHFRSSPLSEQPADLALVRLRDRLVAGERAATLRRLVLQVVALHGLAAQQLAGAGH